MVTCLVSWVATKERVLGARYQHCEDIDINEQVSTRARGVTVVVIVVVVVIIDMNRLVEQALPTSPHSLLLFSFFYISPPPPPGDHL